MGGALGTYGSAAAGGVDQATLDLNVTYFVGARAATPIFAEGKIIRRGRSVAFGETRVTDASGTLVAVGRATYMIIQPRRLISRASSTVRREGARAPSAAKLRLASDAEQEQQQDHAERKTEQPHQDVNHCRLLTLRGAAARSPQRSRRR